MGKNGYEILRMLPSDSVYGVCDYLEWSSKLFILQKLNI